MQCPHCGYNDAEKKGERWSWRQSQPGRAEVVDTRPASATTIRRSRRCPSCNRRFATIEMPDQPKLELGPEIYLTLAVKLLRLIPGKHHSKVLAQLQERFGQDGDGDQSANQPRG